MVADGGRKMKRIIGSLGLFLIAKTVLAIPLTNGDFSNSSDWADASGNGSTQIMGGEAILETGLGTDPYSSIFVQGDDGFFNFSNPISLDSSYDTLSFDVRFEDLGIDATEAGGSFFSDYLLVALYDADDFNNDLIFDPGVDSSVSTMTTFSLDVSSLAGHNIALSFELSDEDDGLNSRVYLDNVSFFETVVGVPEPQSLVLFGLGAIALFGTKARRRKEV